MTKIRLITKLLLGTILILWAIPNLLAVPQEAGIFLKHIQELSSEKYQGRLAATEGELLTIDYIRKNLLRSGQLVPFAALQDGFVSKFDLSITKLNATETTLAIGERSLSLGDDYLPFSNSSSSTERIFDSAYIVSCEELEISAKQSTNRLAILFENECNEKIIEQNLSLSEIVNRIKVFSPSAILVVAKKNSVKSNDTLWAGYLDSTVSNRFGDLNELQENLVLSQLRSSSFSSGNTYSDNNIAAVYITKQAISSLIDQAQAIPSSLIHFAHPLKIKISLNEKRMAGNNLIMHLPGKSDRNIILSAHLDGFGVNINNDLHPGADDNASGVALLMELAQYYAGEYRKNKFETGIIFAFFSGEEWGLKGSTHFAQALLTNKLTSKIVANLNFDGVGRSNGQKFYLLGELANPDLTHFIESFDLSDIQFSKMLEFAYFKGSDHFPLHQIQIPSVDITSGKVKEWHTISDHAGLINENGIIKLFNFIKRPITSLLSSEQTFAPSRPEYAPNPFVQSVAHNIQIELSPKDGHYILSDTLGFNQLPELLKITSLAQNISLKLDSQLVEFQTITKDNSLEIRPNYNEDHGKLTISYSVSVDPNATAGEGDNHFGQSQENPIVVGPQGIYLSPAGYWYPYVESANETFKIMASVPTKWHTITTGIHRNLIEGSQSNIDFWDINFPSESVHLIAGEYQIEEIMHRGVRLQTYFHPELAQHVSSYMEKLKKYFDLYLNRYGSYPFSKFSVVSNFFSTGYGMASYTLLDRNIIPYSFITEISLGHEFAHNFWGNSVYVKFDEGNWCEGLTTYEADYLYSQLSAPEKGKEYRLGVLRDYQNLVTDENVFPLSKFQGRFSPASRAIGYGKAMMFFHMLENKIGTNAFIGGLTNIINKKSYSALSYHDLRPSFENSSQQPLMEFFNQWIERTDIANLSLEKKITSSIVEVILTQKNDSPYDLLVPLKIIFSDKSYRMQNVHLSTLAGKVIFHEVKPVADVLLDPDFQLMRKLEQKENPATLFMFYGKTNKHFYSFLPNEEEVNEQLSEVIKLLPESSAEDKLEHLTFSGNLSQNIVRPTMLFVSARDIMNADITNLLAEEPRIKLADNAIFIDDDNKTYRLSKNNFIVLNLTINTFPVLLVISPDEEIPAENNIGKKLSHYGKYSFLEFDNKGNKITAQTWSITQH